LEDFGNLDALSDRVPIVASGKYVSYSLQSTTRCMRTDADDLEGLGNIGCKGKYGVLNITVELGDT
jgi:hypothetical protein